MKAINDYIVIEKIKERKTTSGGLLLTDDTDTDNRYKKAKVVSVGNLAELIKEGSNTISGMGGDEWPDGIFTKAGRQRNLSPSGLMKGMTQLTFPVADPIYDNMEEHAGELRDDTPPLSAIQRTWRGNYNNDYQIPPESLNYTHLSTGQEENWPWAGHRSPEGAPDAGTPEASGKYRRVQKNPHRVVKLDKTQRYVKGRNNKFGDPFKSYSQRNAETTARLKNQPKDWWNRGGKGSMQDGKIKLKDLLG